MTTPGSYAKPAKRVNMFSLMCDSRGSPIELRISRLHMGSKRKTWLKFFLKFPQAYLRKQNRIVMSARTCLTLAALFGFLAVLIGAFGAHGLSDSGFLKKKYADMDEKDVSGMKLPAAYKYLQDYRTGVRYHMWHALALFGVGLLMRIAPSKLLASAAWCFVGGILLFSGALYVLVVCGPDAGGIKWGMVAPIGGTLQLIGWGLLAFACFRLPAISAEAT